MEKYTLNTAIMYDGETITEVEMDLDGLTVKDLEKAEREARAMLGKKENLAVPETNKKYLACVAAKAASVKSDMIFSLKARDYTQLTLLVMNFLLGGGSDSEEELEEDENQSSSIPSLGAKTSKSVSMESPRAYPN